MNEVEKVKKICKDRNIPISTIEKSCGFCNGYIAGLKKGVFPSDRLIKIADYLSVPLSELSETAATIDYDYIVIENGEKTVIDREVKAALAGPHKDLLLTYAKKLNELSKLEK